MLSYENPSLGFSRDNIPQAGCILQKAARGGRDRPVPSGLHSSPCGYCLMDR